MDLGINRVRVVLGNNGGLCGLSWISGPSVEREHSRGGSMDPQVPPSQPGSLDHAIGGPTIDGPRDGQGPRVHRAGQTRLLNRGTGGCTLVSSQGPSTVVGL